MRPHENTISANTCARRNLRTDGDQARPVGSSFAWLIVSLRNLMRMIPESVLRNVRVVVYTHAYVGNLFWKGG